jgi:DNA-binding response OmpR family regulator
MLLVDDEHDVSRAYKTVLQDVQYECDSSTYSVKATQEFRPNYYEVIILDIKTSAILSRKVIILTMFKNLGNEELIK